MRAPNGKRILHLMPASINVLGELPKNANSKLA